jgi:hypothetical protein
MSFYQVPIFFMSFVRVLIFFHRLLAVSFSCHRPSAYLFYVICQGANLLQCLSSCLSKWCRLKFNECLICVSGVPAARSRSSSTVTPHCAACTAMGSTDRASVRPHERFNRNLLFHYFAKFQPEISRRMLPFQNAPLLSRLKYHRTKIVLSFCTMRLKTEQKKNYLKHVDICENIGVLPWQIFLFFELPSLGPLCCLCLQ